MSKTLAAILIILVICQIIIFGAIGIKLYSPSTSKNQANNLLGNNPENSPKSIVLPMDINNSRIVASSLNFSVEGNLKGIEPTEGGKKLLTDIQFEGFPALLMTGNTQVFLYDGIRSLLVSNNDLKIGQKIRVVLVYGLKIKRWTLSRVNIIVPSISPGSIPAI